MKRLLSMLIIIMFIATGYGASNGKLNGRYEDASGTVALSFKENEEPDLCMAAVNGGTKNAPTKLLKRVS